MLQVVTGSVVGGSGVTLLARVLGQAGELVTRATFSSIAYALTDMGAFGTSPGTPATGSIPTTAVYNDLQAGDPRWTADTAGRPTPDGRTGYNFAYTLPASLMTSNNRQQCEVIFTPVTGEKFRIVFQWTPQAVYG